MSQIGRGPVDDHFRLSPLVERITPAKDSDPEPPTVGAVGMWLGVKPTTIKRKTDRLMHSVERTSDVPPPPPCPTCGHPASSSSLRRESGTVTGDYLCPQGHIFTMRWMEVA